MRRRGHSAARNLRMGDFVKAAGRGGRAMARTSSGGSDGKLEEGLEFFCRISGDWREKGSCLVQASDRLGPSMAQAPAIRTRLHLAYGLRPAPKRAVCLISALSGRDEFCRGREGGGGDARGGLACRLHGLHGHAGARGRRHGGDDLAVSPRARPFGRQDRSAAHGDRRTAGAGDGRHRHHGSQRGRLVLLPDRGRAHRRGG